MKSEQDFKELFMHLASIGAGRPVGSDGLPIGPWTPELLTQAITTLAPSGQGIELRTVQHWFQDNDKGISRENAHWLARIFGCGDQEATSAWLSELMAAQRRLVTKRKSKEPSIAVAQQHVENVNSIESNGKISAPSASAGPYSSLPRVTVDLFTSKASIGLPVLVFAGASGLAIMALSLRVHSVVFAYNDGPPKQVGFLWAPNWTIVFLLLLPLYLAAIVALLQNWTNAWRPHLVQNVELPSPVPSWRFKAEQSSPLFWAIFILTIGLASALNWFVTHFLPLVSGDTKDWVVDWGKIAVFRPDLISVPTSLFFTALVFVYNGFSSYIFFAGLLLLHFLTSDYLDIATNRRGKSDHSRKLAKQRIGYLILRCVFLCTALGMIITILMKLQSGYLLSNSKNILHWLASDIAVFSGLQAQSPTAVTYTLNAPGNYYSFLSMIAIYGVFMNASMRLKPFVVRNPDVELSHVIRRDVSLMNVAMNMLAGSYILSGLVPGFSILLATTLVLTTYLIVHKSCFSEGLTFHDDTDFQPQ
jgi:hypothetical protein